VCDPEIPAPAEPDYDVSVHGPYRFGIETTDVYEGWVELTVDDEAFGTYSPEVLDEAVRAFCQVLHQVSPIRVTKRASASARRPGVFFPEQ
jgi:hypothetical protein